MVWTHEEYQFFCLCAIVRVKVVFRKTVVGDWRFNCLSGSHLQSQVKSLPRMMVFMRQTAECNYKFKIILIVPNTILNQAMYMLRVNHIEWSVLAVAVIFWFCSIVKHYRSEIHNAYGCKRQYIKSPFCSIRPSSPSSWPWQVLSSLRYIWQDWVQKCYRLHKTRDAWLFLTSDSKWTMPKVSVWCTG